MSRQNTIGNQLILPVSYTRYTDPTLAYCSRMNTIEMQLSLQFSYAHYRDATEPTGLL